MPPDAPPPPHQRSTLRDISWLGAANATVKPLWLGFLLVLCPRVLGDEGYGAFSVALATVSIALAYVDLGMSAYTVREVAGAPRLASRFFSNFVPVRLAAAVAGVVLALGAAVASSTLAVGTLAAAAVYKVAESAAGYARTYYRAAEAFRSDALATVAEKAAVVALGGAALLVFRTPGAVLAGMAAGGAVFAGAVLRHVSAAHARFRPRLWSPQFARTALWAMAPLGVLDLLTTVYLRTDQVMIGVLLGDDAAGVYALAYRVLEALTIVPAIVVQSVLYPRLSRLAGAGEAGEIRRVLWRGTLGLLAISGAIVAVVYLLGPWALRLMVGAGAFDASGGLLRVLVWTFPFTCLSNLFFFYHIASDSVRRPMVALAGAAVLNVSLNAWALPRFGVEGAAWATVIAEALIVALYVSGRDVRRALSGVPAPST